MIPDADEHIPQPFPWIDIMLLTGGKKGIHHSRPLGSFMGTGEEVILPAQGQRTDFILDLVIVDLHTSVFEVMP